MENFLRLALFLTGVLNLLPSALAFLPQKIESAYGVALSDANYELLLRHRAVLFAIVGGLMLYAAFAKRLYVTAAVCGLSSMAAFAILYFMVNGKVNSALQRVMWLDVAGTVLLAFALIAYLCKPRRSAPL